MPRTKSINASLSSRSTPPWLTRLLAWFAIHRRPMPWRDQPTPYRIWVSEIMLQQTQVNTVRPYFDRFIAAFPTLKTLAQASEQAVLKLWEGLGYYTRARNLLRAARIVVDQHHGELPRTAAELAKLPGVGPYTAAAVAGIAFGDKVPAVDGNVSRVAARFFALHDDISKPTTRATITSLLTPIIATTDPAQFTPALMELGSLVCRPTPNCPACPIQADCAAWRLGLTTTLPNKRRKPPTPHHHIAVGVCWRHGKILIGRRRDDQMLGGLWEFPGGKCNTDETPQHAVVREIREETGLVVRPGKIYAVVDHAYSHFSITLTAFRCSVISGRATPKSAAELRWVRLDQLDEFPFPKANQRVLEAIRRNP